MNKSVAKIGSKTGQKFYSNVFNFVEAKNNDGKCDLNFATYSTELCEKLLSMYGNEGMTIYDPFCGTGTTGVACKNLGMDFIGSEISTSQCEYAEHRLSLANRNFSKTTLALNFGDM